MKYYKVLIILGLFMILLSYSSCVKNNDVIVTIHNEKQKEFLNNFILYNNYDVEIIDNGIYLIMKNTTLEMWLEIRNILKIEMDVISDNIANVSTTRTVNGGPFIRNIVMFTLENGLEIVSDTSTEKRFIYEPTHPDAILTGVRQGYVEYSNVDTVIEMVNMIAVSNFYNSITEYLKNKYKNIIL